MRQVGSGLGESLLREPTLGDILNRTYNPAPPIAVPGPVGDRAQVLDRTVRHPQPDLVIEDAVATSRCLDLVRQQRDIFRMDATPNPLERYGGITIKLEGAIKLL